jgi:hypothetical protein
VRLWVEDHSPAQLAKLSRELANRRLRVVVASFLRALRMEKEEATFAGAGPGLRRLEAWILREHSSLDEYAFGPALLSDALR